MDKRAFKNTVLLIIELAGSKGIGAIKLNKCLLIYDAMYYALHKESFTDTIYTKNHFGPVPYNEAKSVIDEMVNCGDILLTKTKWDHNKHENNHTLAHGLKAPRDYFLNDDIERIKSIVDKVMEMSANELSNITHDREYHKTMQNETINLNEIFEWKVIDDIEYTKEDDKKLEEILKDNFDDFNTFVRAT